MSFLRRPTIAILGVLVVLLAADSVAWWLVTARMEREATAWQAARRAEGYEMAAGPASAGGWPLHATLVLPGVHLATGPDTAAVSWDAERVQLDWAPWAPRIVTLFLLGTQTLRLGQAVPVRLQAGQLDVVIPLDAAGQAAGVRMDGRALSLPLPGGALEVGALTLRLDGSTLDATASRIAVPGLPLGGGMDAASIRVRSTVPIPSSRDPAANAAAWRRAGGRAVVEDAALRWGKLDARATALLELDAALQPAGTGTVHLSGFEDAIDGLVRAGQLPRNQAKVATAVLGLMSRPGPAGIPEAELPLLLTGGVLKMGAMPLLRVPALTWP